MASTEGSLASVPEAVAVPATIPTAPITLRAPTTTAAPSSSAFTAPSLEWLSGTWYVTHSTLPMWKKSRNVAITYKPLDPSTPDGTPKIDDLVTYNGLKGDKVKSVSGTDTAAGLGAWNWRGNGWLKIASSHWEVLGYGGEEGAEQWVVTYFAKTLFTPTGIDIYSRKKEGLSQGLLKEVTDALARVDAEVVKKLADEVFVVKSDHY